MMSDDDDNSSGHLPDPSDRHWRHPSELRRSGGLPHPDRTPIPALPTDPSRPLRTLFLVGGGLALCVFALTVVGLVDRPPTSIKATEELELASDRSDPPLTAASALSTTTLAAVTALSTTTTRPELVNPYQRWLAEPLGLVASDSDGAEIVASLIPINGHMITSAMAVVSEQELWLNGPDARVQAQISAIDFASDIALIEIAPSPQSLPPIIPPVVISDQTLFNGQPVEIGHITASGAPSDDSRRGTVFTLNKAAKTRGEHIIYDAIGVDLPTRARDAGAVAFDANGHVLGVVIDNQEANLSLLPAERVANIAASLATFGIGNPSWLGINTVTSDGDVGLEVLAVMADSPVGVALESGDVLMAVGGEQLVRNDQLNHLVRSAGPGGTLELEVLRDGMTRNVTVAVGSIND